MLRLAVLADVHGNSDALNAVLEDADRQEAAGVIVAGDLTGCPGANEMFARLRERRAWIILGNSDINLLQLSDGSCPAEWRTHKQFGLLRWVLRDIDPDHLAFLRSLPLEHRICVDGSAEIQVVHGSPRSPYEGLSPELEPENFEEAVRLFGTAVMICGHTHLPWKVRRDGWLALNPGAVCGTLNGDRRAQYAILTWNGVAWDAEHRAVAYDTRRIVEQFLTSGLLDEGGPLARAFLLSIQTAVNVGEYFLDYTYQIAADAGCEGCSVVPDEIWDAAGAGFDWQAFERLR